GLSIAAILIVAPAGVAGLLRRLWESRRVRALRLRLALDDAAEVRPPASPEEAAA
ncbi:MAG: hypothetical protein HY690_07585, partial [Chloroflexi bacterium]|nr:hypothetical protein [Chloroflexota bacterium]